MERRTEDQSPSPDLPFALSGWQASNLRPCSFSSTSWLAKEADYCMLYQLSYTPSGRDLSIVGGLLQAAITTSCVSRRRRSGMPERRLTPRGKPFGRRTLYTLFLSKFTFQQERQVRCRGKLGRAIVSVALPSKSILTLLHMAVDVNSLQAIVCQRANHLQMRRALNRSVDKPRCREDRGG